MVYRLYRSGLNHGTVAVRLCVFQKTIKTTAIAGYDPINAVKVWERMAANSGGQAPPEILSTHPSNQTRINELTALIPQAKAEAAKFGVTFK